MEKFCDFSLSKGFLDTILLFIKNKLINWIISKFKTEQTDKPDYIKMRNCSPKPQLWK